MFDNRWDNWAGDFAESFGVSLLDPAVRKFVPDILSHFGAAVRRIDRDFPDEVSSGTFATVLSELMPRMSLPEAARAQVPEVVARFFEYLQESGRVGEGSDWATQVRIIGRSPRGTGKPGADVKGVTIRKADDGSKVGRNDPCPCGSGKKYKKCCQTRD